MDDSVLVKTNQNISGNLLFENDEFIFKYSSENEDDYISLTMPNRYKDYNATKLFPIFEMHLPEGYLLSIIKKHFSKLTKIDDFGLLKLMSPNIKGRVNYTHLKMQEESILTLDNLLYPKSKTLFDDLVTRFALKSGLSGVQPKVLAQIHDKATLALEDYIVKSWGDEYPNLAINEYYSMQVVKKAGVSVPEFYLSNDNKLFIMKRFDVRDDGTYLGFEDMCVIQAKQASDKYEGTYEAIAKSIKAFVSPKNKKSSLIQFFKMIVINNLVQNGDAHLKNFGLLYSDKENIKLAPAYDVICTTIYIKNDISALNLMGSKKWWAKKYLVKFGVEVCTLSLKNANEFYNECESSFLDVQKEIKERITIEKDEEVRVFLTSLFSTKPRKILQP